MKRRREVEWSATKPAPPSGLPEEEGSGTQQEEKQNLSKGG